MGSGLRAITSRCLDFVLPEHTLSFCASDAILWGAIGCGWEKAHNLVDPGRPIRISTSGTNQLTDLEPVRHLEKTHQHGEPLEITNHGAHYLLGFGPAERGLSAALSAKVERQ
jgi:hypothetical protein